ncbi:MAG: transcription-repair coupling factor [Candidatus Muirbacterium halophilum]|nr:transcription-repair coupling factor [Candidatus Muirbacterium halophilum]MCK9475999.1 transcription-repair coupling factor [Candidatus Muirbacterium halophilum]
MIVLEETRSFFNNLKSKKFINNLYGDSLFLYLNVFKNEKNIILVKDNDTAMVFFEKLQSISETKNILLFREWDKLFFDNTLPDEFVEGDRINTLYKMSILDSFFCICTVKSFYSGIINLDFIKKQSLKLKKDNDINFEKTISNLSEIGYKRVDSPEKAGHFSVRGEILEIWLYDRNFPLRIDCPFDNIEKINLFDSDTNLNIKNSDEDEIIILPAKEIIKNENYFKEKFKNKELSLENLYDNYPDIYIKNSYIFKEFTKTNIFIYEEELLKNSYFYLEKEFKSFELDNSSIFSDYFEIQKTSYNKRYISNTISYGEDFDSKIEFCGSFNKDMSLVSEKILVSLAKNQTVWLCFANRARFLRMKEILSEYSINLLDGSLGYTGKNDAYGLICDIRAGFFIKDYNIVVIGEDDIWGETKIIREIRREKRKKKNIFDVFSELKEGDYVVHINHGIGIYNGIKKIRVGVTNREFFNIKYAGSDELFVPIECADFIHKYIGQEKPSLYTLEGKRWANSTKKVRKKVKDIAKDLIKLYSERMQAKGFSFQKDTEWQYEMEAGFPYEETEDQKKVLEEIKEDMEKPSPMDRLVCGDVGYGKTELAIRAAFKAVLSGKQVAVLAPTTILVEQHARTFTERCNMFPVKIESVSRMKTSTQTKEIFENLKNGDIDIIIGTHRLLSKKIQFGKLGLLIIDEEQRFGVEHKEKIKQIKQNIDVLTMSATPIPRTLNMALNGIRDISIIETAPDNRQPIKTFVVPFSENVLREAILREKERGGQVYYLYNNVQTIEVIKKRLESIMPEISFKTAHGQMHRNELNVIMDDFLHKKFDCLITTTIIESGIDIPNVNTIIVENSHKFGLSQLYQLKGRVGRSERQAYAYLFYKKDNILTPKAFERLKTLREYTDLGSGFKIAMKDLEIRGAGNVFGNSQHGFIDEVGFEMYCKILKEVVSEEKGESFEDKREIRISLPIDAYIPDYLESSRQSKIKIYRQIALADTEIEISAITGELRDMYGRLPKEINNLLKISLLKVLGRKIQLKEILEYDKNNLILKFYKLNFTEDGLARFLQEFASIINLSVNITDAIVIKKKIKDYHIFLETIQKILHYIKFCVNIEH